MVGTTSTARPSSTTSPRLDGVLPDGGSARCSHSRSLRSKTPRLLSGTAPGGGGVRRQPDLIVILSVERAAGAVLPRAWANRPAAPLRLVSSEAVPMLGDRRGRERKLRGHAHGQPRGVTHATRDGSAYGPFRIRYGIRFSGGRRASTPGHLRRHHDDLAGAERSAAGDASGTDIAMAIRRLADPRPRRSRSARAVVHRRMQQALEAGDSDATAWVSGPLDFDLDSGDTRRETDGWDVSPPPVRRASVQPSLRARPRPGRHGRDGTITSRQCVRIGAALGDVHHAAGPGSRRRSGAGTA
jgi:hypothetical protein